MNKKSWIIFTIVTVGILGLLIFVSKNSQNGDIDLTNVDVYAVQTANDNNGQISDHIYGNEKSKVTLINYGDFQCPGCGSIHPVIRSVVEKHKDEIRFIFRNFILSYHTNARAAAGAAEAAGLQGKYWEMHNLIYESQASWESLGVDDRTVFFDSLAKQLNLDLDKFKQDMPSENAVAKMKYDYNLGIKSGVDSTPSFYLNGEKLDSSVWGEEETLNQRIVNEINKFN